jgi:hypothetical protein
LSFSLTFFVRPFGGVILSHIGDRTDVRRRWCLPCHSWAVRRC